MKRIRIAAYQITPVIYEDDGTSLVRMKAGATEVPADELAKYVVGLQREVAALEQKANEPKETA